MRYLLFLFVFLLAWPAAATPLSRALFVVAQALPAPYAPPDKAETAAVERAAFLGKLAGGLASAAQEATCEGDYAADSECRRKWPGPAEEVAAFALTLGWFESKLDPEVQAGRCAVWGPAPSQIGCDGQLFRSGYAPPALVGVERRTKWGLVVFTSNTVFQVKVATNERVREIVGDGEMHVFEASREAVKIISSSRGNCRAAASWPECVATSYAGSSTFKQAPIRAAMFRKVLPKVRAAMRDPDAPSA